MRRSAPADAAVAVRRRAERLSSLPAMSTARAVQLRYRDAGGTALAASITLYLFLALFAVTVLAVAVLGFLSAGGAHLARDLPSQLGVSGSASRLVRRSVDTAERRRAAATVCGVLGLAWTGSGLGVAISLAFDAAWRVEPRGLGDRARSLVWLVGAIAAIAVGAFATAGWSTLPSLFTPLVIAVSVASNTALFLWTAWFLPNRRVPLAALVPTAVLGGVALEVLKLLGAYVVPRLVAQTSAVYGTIGVVFALLVWLLLIGRVVMYVAVIEALRWERRASAITARCCPPRRDAGHRRGRRCDSRLEALERPAGPGPPVLEPVVQPVVAVLPELDRPGVDEVAAPERRERDVVAAEAVLDRARGGLQRGPVADRRALPGRPRADAAGAGPGAPVRLRFHGGQPRDRTGRPHLPALLAPVPHQRRPRVRRQVGALGAVVACVEAEPGVVEPAQQHHPGARRPRRARGGHDHGVVVREPRRLGGLEPAPELLDRLRRDVGLPQLGHAALSRRRGRAGPAPPSA
jgi:membrane protein